MSDSEIQTILANDPITQSPRFREWMEKHEIRINDCYKLVVYKSRATLYYYDRNERGRFYMDLSTGKAKILPPVTIDIHRPVPLV